MIRVSANNFEGAPEEAPYGIFYSPFIFANLSDINSQFVSTDYQTPFQFVASGAVFGDWILNGDDVLFAKLWIRLTQLMTIWLRQKAKPSPFSPVSISSMGTALICFKTIFAHEASKTRHNGGFSVLVAIYEHFGRICQSKMSRQNSPALLFITKSYW